MSALLTLNATALRNRIAERGLRQWWLAEQLGVDRRTVLRWVNGQVTSMAQERAAQLAAVLGCPVSELLLHDPQRQLASPEDQRAAGLALASSQLMDRLGPVGEWNVIEQLVRASTVADLPVHVLGRLYHQLSVACWRQSKLAEAQLHNSQALALAQRCGDESLRADALNSSGNLAFWKGDLSAAWGAWHTALALAPWLSARQLGSLHSNLGAALAETGQSESGRTHLLAALTCFEREGEPMNHAIAHANLALLALRLGENDEAHRRNQRARHHARRADYRRGLALADLVDAVLAAKAQQREAAIHLLGRAEAAFAQQGIAESLNNRLAAEVWLALGDPSSAQQATDEALRLAARFPLEQTAAQDLSRRVTGAADAAALRSRPSNR